MRYYDYDYVEHSLASYVKDKISKALSGRVGKNHKYYKRLDLGKDKRGKNKYRYFYTKAEWDAYNKAKSVLNSVSNNSGDILKLGKNIVSGYYSILIGDSTIRVNDKIIGGHKTYLDVDTGGFWEHVLGIPMVRIRTVSVKDDNRHDNISDLTTPSEKSKSVDYIKVNHPKDPPKYIARVKTSNGYRYFYSRKEYEKYLERNGPKKVSDLDKLSSSDSSFDSVTKNIKEINPHYLSGEDWQTNCGDCSLAYEMRRRGYDVMADDHDADYSNWAENGGITSVFPGATPDYYDLTDSGDPEKATEKLCKDMSNNYPDGSRGVMDITWADNNGAHMIAWEMHNNEPYFIDAQSGSVMSGSEFSKYMSHIDFEESKPEYRWTTSDDPLSLTSSYIAANGKSTSIMTTRLDNCSVNDTVTNQVIPNSKNQNENHELESEAKANDPDNYEDPNPGYYSNDDCRYTDSNGSVWDICYYTSNEDGNTHFVWKSDEGDVYDPSGYYYDVNA